MTNKVKQKVLVVGYLPPPQEGTAKIGEILYNSKILNNEFNVNFLKLIIVKNSGDRGKFALWNIVINIINITRFLSRVVFFNPSLVYINMAQNKLGFLRDSFFILLAKLFRRKIMVHFHGGNFDSFYSNSSIAYKRYVRYVLGKVDKLAILANKFKNQFDGLIKMDDIEVVYNPVPRLDLPLRNDIFKNNDKIMILYMGYISKAKGAVDLVKAVALLKQKYQNIFVNLCGQRIDIENNIKYIDDPNNAYSKIMEIVKNSNLENNIKFLGVVEGSEKEKQFMESDIFILPSYSEGCPVAVMEAMSYGLPLIVTNVGALDEMLKENENCLFVAPGDYNAIAEKIAYLIDNPKYRKAIGENNNKLVKLKYSLEIFCKELSKIWSGVLAGKKNQFIPAEFDKCL